MTPGWQHSAPELSDTIWTNTGVPFCLLVVCARALLRTQIGARGPGSCFCFDHTQRKEVDTRVKSAVSDQTNRSHSALPDARVFFCSICVSQQLNRNGKCATLHTLKCHASKTRGAQKLHLTALDTVDLQAMRNGRSMVLERTYRLPVVPSLFRVSNMA